MFTRSTRAMNRLLILISTIIALFLTASLFGRMMPTADQRPTEARSMGVARLGDVHGNATKNPLTREEQSAEARVWHEANQQSLRGPEGSAAMALKAETSSQDINDITVIQGDARLVIAPRFFDLNLRAVSFTPANSGYSIATTSSLFDNNLGARRDLSVAPAVNPLGNAEPGDDAYLIEDLGFDFNFFGVNYSSVALTSNGNLVFRPGGTSQAAFDKGAVSSVAKLSEFQTGLPRIAAYWHDLDARPAALPGENGVYVRKSADRVMFTWSNVRDFPSNPSTDNGVHRFQITLFNTGRIAFTYDAATLTSQALVGITPGQSRTTPRLVDLSLPPNESINTPVAEFFSLTTRFDYLAAVKAFYDTHPNQDNYDFISFFTDFDYDLGGAFAFYDPVRNDATGIGLPQSDPDTTDLLGSRRIQGILNLSNISSAYPAFPTTRFLGANHGLSIMAHELGHRWLSFVKFPGTDLALLGRDNAHWNFFLNTESTISHPAARRSSSLEGNAWVDNANGTFTSVGLVDGYSRLDQYLMGFRSASTVGETFVIVNPAGSASTKDSAPQPGVTTGGFRQRVAVEDIVQANNTRLPEPDKSQRSFRTAVVLVTRQNTAVSDGLLDKVQLYRFAFESYFRQSTDLMATINTGLSADGPSRAVVAASAASYQPVLAPGAIASLFGTAFVAGEGFAFTNPLPTTLSNLQIRINGVPAPLFFVSANQINFQIPRTTAATTLTPQASSATALIEVFNEGKRIRAGAVQIAPTAPAVFTVDASGNGPAVAVDAIRGGGAPFNPKQPNGLPTILALFATGLGADATDGGGDVSSNVQALINGVPTIVGYAGRAPGFTGLNQINIHLPENISSGIHSLVITRNGIPSRQVTIAVR